MIPFMLALAQRPPKWRHARVICDVLYLAGWLSLAFAWTRIVWYR